MMRFLFILLVLSNLSYCVYNGLSETGRGGRVAQLHSSHTLANQILLLDEAIARGEALSGGESQDGSLLASAAHSALCTQIGAFPDRQTAEQVQQRLMSASISSGIKTIDVPIGVDYLVYIPPLSSRELAVRKVRAMQVNHVDGYVITEGKLSNGISLGLFKEKKRAEQLLKTRQAEGYEVKLTEVKRFASEHWIEVRKEDRELLGTALWNNIQARFHFAEKVDHLCESDLARSE